MVRRTLVAVVESVTHLEQNVDRLRGEVRQAAMSGDRTRAHALRGELRRAERAWASAIAGDPPAAPTPTAPPSVREPAHRALTLLGAPAAPRLVAAVHEALYGAEIPGPRLAGLRRSEERAYAAAPRSRPFYVCAALDADRLTAARGLLAMSTWALADRIVGPLSPRVDFLISAARVARHVEGLTAPAARRLLWRFAASIPGAAESVDTMRPAGVARAAEAELAVHRAADRDARAAAATRAARLTDVEQLFGRDPESAGLPDEADMAAASADAEPRSGREAR